MTHELRVVMVTADIEGNIEQGLELANEPTVILQGSIAAVREAGRLFDQAVKLTPTDLAPDAGVVAELVEALRSNLVFAETIIEATDIDPEETALKVRVMPEGREVARRTWAEVLNETRTLIDKLETRA